jgi:hypothetical protein
VVSVTDPYGRNLGFLVRTYLLIVELNTVQDKHEYLFSLRRRRDSGEQTLLCQCFAFCICPLGDHKFEIRRFLKATPLSNIYMLSNKFMNCTYTSVLVNSCRVSYVNIYNVYYIHRNRYTVYNSIYLSTTRETTSSAATHEFRTILWNPKVQYSLKRALN